MMKVFYYKRKGRKLKVYQFDASCQYAGDSPEFKVIPAGYINKTICGCGLTSVAIESAENCIIAVPNVALVVNKVGQYYNKQDQGNPLSPSKVRERYSGDVFGVTEGVDKEDIERYVKRVQKAGTPIKIMVTYDSLHKCELYLNDCHLIIDESDKLVLVLVDDKTDFAIKFLYFVKIHPKK